MEDFVRHFSEEFGAFRWREGCDDNFVIVWGHCGLGFKTFNGGFCTSFQ